MRFAHFKSLMWKNYRLKMYHSFSTAMELLVPILFALLLWAGISHDRNTPPLQITPYSTRSVRTLTILNLELCYFPHNNITSAFMRKLEEKDPVHLTTIPMLNENDIEQYVLNDTRKSVVGVDLQNLKSDKSTPYKFNYTIMHLVSSIETYSNLFLKTQLILNENFIEYVGSDSADSKKLMDKLDIQIFPTINHTIKTELMLLQIFVLTTFCLTIVLLADITEEKNSGMTEMIKISGVNELTIWFCWFLYALLLSSLSITVSCALLTMLPMEDGTTAYRNVPFVVIWLLPLLWHIASISFCFFMTSVIQNFQNAYKVFINICLMPGVLVSVALSLDEPELHIVPLYVWCFCPMVAFLIGLEEIRYIEIREISFTWSTLINSQNKDVQVPFGILYVYFTLIFDSLLFLFLAYYITMINPGKFGTPKSPFFLFKKSSKKAGGENPTIPNPSMKLDPKYFELPQSNLNQSLQIIDLHKRFKSLHAVRGVNLIIYQNEITVLLGHNGAGKTTTLSVLTGITAPSSGQAFYKGIDVFGNMREFRSHLGWCPQENRFFEYLSVMDHLLFFGQLKGVSKKDATKEAEEYLNIIDMTSKMDSNVDMLSGGMKRKLSLSIAMMGKAEVLILDEPSSGMDAEARRSLRNLLLKIRKGRSLIITTHYMEEAELLGDRVAIMNQGVIVCHGTPMFLKRAYDTGYELTVTKTSDNSAAITQLIQSALPTASVISDINQKIVYKLPLTETHQFPALFKSLESAKTKLGVKTIGVTATTIEQVFLMASNSTAAIGQKSLKNIERAAKFDRVTGVWLILQQLQAIIEKKLLFTKRDRFLIFKTFIFVTLIWSVLIILADNIGTSWSQTPHTVSLSTYPSKIVMYEEKNPFPFGLGEQVGKYVTENYGIFMHGNGSGIDQMIHSVASESLRNYTKNVASGINLNGSRTKLMYINSSMGFSIRNSLPIAIDLYSNALLRKETNNDQYSIETTSNPVVDENIIETAGSANLQNCISGLYVTINIFLWFIVFGFIFSCNVFYFWNYASMERLDGFYHIQMMSHLPPFVYWLGTFIFDFTLFSILTIIQLIMYKTITSIRIIGFHDFFYAYVLLIFLYTVSSLILFYTLTYVFNYRETQLEYYTFILLYSFILPMILVFFGIFTNNLAGYLMYCLPPTAFYGMLIYMFVIFNNNDSCSYCPEPERTECEATLVKLEYWKFESDDHRFGLLTFVLAFCGQIVAYSILLYLFYSEYSIFNIIKGRIFSKESTLEDIADDDVKEERDQVQRLFSETKKSNKNSLLVDRLRKIYSTMLSKFTAVAGVSFAVERGTCFGLLGINGAGKTTTFKMLTAEILPTSGDAMIDGYKLSKNKAKYILMAGYCPQTNSFIERLTGFELLMIIAALRGVVQKDRMQLVDKWISIIGLNEYKDRRCGTYSGGNKRKLCAAMALIGDPSAVFLDEPTTGVDAASRHNLYDITNQSRILGQTIILTSHSMEECEILCDRLTIMVDGVMKCIGSVQDLKKRYAQGFTAVLKIFDSPEANEKIPELKNTITNVFKSSVIMKDERTTSLIYQITDTSLSWSALFTMMENIKSSHKDVVQDYVITDTSLEEVFISFAGR